MVYSHLELMLLDTKARSIGFKNLGNLLMFQQEDALRVLEAITSKASRH